MEGTTVALDGIAIIVNNDNKVADLTVDQLKQMFTGEITNWSEVGGDDGEIVLIGREAGPAPVTASRASWTSRTAASTVRS